MSGAESGSVSLAVTGKYPTVPFQGPFTTANKIGEEYPLDYTVVSQNGGGKMRKTKSYKKRRGNKRKYNRKRTHRRHHRRVPVRKTRKHLRR